ncbi:MAG: hypothetical protein GKR77_03120 [Legionellales bacterium]|nr:hypothetical protein [Legionellales bacterium]
MIMAVTTIHSTPLPSPVSLLQSHEFAQSQSLTPQSSRDAYFRSRLYTAQYGANPLLIAAQPLISLCERMQATNQINQDSRSLAYLVQHELNAFQTHVVNLDYPSDLFEVTRHVLALVIDDILLHHPHPELFDWQQHRLLKANPQATDTFFTLLERLLAAPDQYVDVLELMYVCLKLGYQGKFRHSHEGQHLLTAFTDRVYFTLTQHQSKSKNPALLKLPASSHAAPTTTWPSTFMLLLFTLVLLLIGFYALNYLLNFIAEPLVHQLQVVQQYAKQTLHWLY